MSRFWRLPGRVRPQNLRVTPLRVTSATASARDTAASVMCRATEKLPDRATSGVQRPVRARLGQHDPGYSDPPRTGVTACRQGWQPPMHPHHPRHAKLEQQAGAAWRPQVARLATQEHPARLLARPPASLHACMAGTRAGRKASRAAPGHGQGCARRGDATVAACMRQGPKPAQTRDRGVQVSAGWHAARRSDAARDAAQGSGAQLRGSRADARVGWAAHAGMQP